MRVLIIGLPRTGSTSLLKKISEEKRLIPIFEPFAPNIVKNGTYKTKFENEDNVVVKTLITSKPNGVNDKIGWLINFSSLFDEIILLTRRDLIDCAKSWAYLTYQRKKNKFTLTSDTEYYWEPTPNYEDVKNDILEWDKELSEISKRLNVGLTYYEDIFDIHSQDRLRKGDKKNEIKIL